MQKVNRKLSIRAVLIMAFTGFTALALGCLLIFQTVFLDDLYEWIKTRQIRAASREIAEYINEEDMASYTSYWRVKEQCSVYVIDADGNTIYRDLLSDVQREILSAEDLKELYRAAEENGGEYASRYEVMLSVPDRHHPDSLRGNRDVPPKPSRQPSVPSGGQGQEISTDVVCVTMALGEGDAPPHAVVVTSILTPVTATVRTLLVQFLIAAIVLIALAALLGIIVAHAVTRPIMAINRAAKTLASDAYDPPPAGGYREVTELKDTLAKTAVELKKAEQLQQELIANLSHDLRTPLTMITGYGEAIRDLPGEQTAENIGVVIEEAERLSHLVTDVLDLSCLRAGTQALSLVPLDLGDTVMNVVQRVRRMTAIYGYEIDIVTDGALPVSVDAIRIEQAIYNLLINALSHTGDDRRVRVVCESDGSTARVAFIDSGSGIPAEEQERIWERYYRVHKGDPLRDTMNSGLGLSIVKTVVELHGGQCGVESQIDEGSTFWFALPLCKK